MLLESQKWVVWACVLKAFNETPDENSVNNPNVQREIFELIERVYFTEPVRIGEVTTDDTAECPFSSFACKNVCDYELKVRTGTF